MIRLVLAVRRQPHLTLSEFQRYWLEEHGPMVAAASSTLGMLRCVQTHRVDDESHVAMARSRGSMEPPHDGVAEFWWDSEQVYTAHAVSEAGRAASAALLADGRQFIDVAHSPVWFAHEYPQVNPTPENIIAAPDTSIARVFFPLRQQGHLDDTAARQYWLTQHGPIVRRGAAAAGILCYRQVHRADTPLNDVVARARGVNVRPYLGHAEVWFDTANPNRSAEAAAASASFVSDERTFIDFSRSTIWLGKENTVVDNR